MLHPHGFVSLCHGNYHTLTALVTLEWLTHSTGTRYEPECTAARMGLQVKHPAAYLTRAVGLKPLLAEALAPRSHHRHHHHHPRHNSSSRTATRSSKDAPAGEWCPKRGGSGSVLLSGSLLFCLVELFLGADALGSPASSCIIICPLGSNHKQLMHTSSS